MNKAFGPIKSSAGNANANRFFMLYKVSCMANLEICRSCLVLVHNPGLNVYKAYQSFNFPASRQLGLEHLFTSAKPSNNSDLKWGSEGRGTMGINF